MNELTDMRTAAIALNELFGSLIAAGFTRREAFELTKAAMLSSFQQGGQK
jgi:hypothetical protein